MSTPNKEKPTNFIRQIVTNDVSAGKNHAQVVTRFPPEPNGYLHIGHAKSIVLNFGIAADFAGRCHLRFDDTNPHKENLEYVTAIKNDVQWLGYDWGEHLYFASDYFPALYDFAVELIKKGLAYVDDLNAEEIRAYRGTLKEPGKDSPYRQRSIEENLSLFENMKAGKYEDGAKVLRAKIDMNSANINLRDPTLYRIRRGVRHHQTGEEWCIYPMYDYTHPISDALEGVTHSICTLEFEDHRPLYDWVLDHITIPVHPQQIEFSRLNLQYTVMSKRKLTQLVDEKYVDSWNDPRMPTIAGLRRRGYTADSIREFCDRIGVTKADNLVEMSVLEDCIRNQLNEQAPRRMAVLRPLKVVIENYPVGVSEELTCANHPQQAHMGTRTIPFSQEIFIDQEDFAEHPPKKYKRLIPGGEVRLRNAYVIKCDRVIKNDRGEVTELRCSYDPDTLGKNPEGRKVKGVIHWVSAPHAIPAQVCLYDRLFIHPTPDATKDGKDYKEYLNPESLERLSQCYLEPSLVEAVTGQAFQFEREGYFCLDEANGANGIPVFNRTVTLRDTWAKLEKQHGSN